MDYSLDPGSVLYCNEILDANGEMVSTDACASIIVTAVNEADTLRTQLADLRQKLGESEWVSVEDRLPDTNGHFLVNVTDREFSWQVSATYFPSLKAFNNWKGRLDGVTHWKTIEPPPQLRAILQKGQS